MARSSNLTVLGDNSSAIEGNKEECRYCWVCFSTEDDDQDATWVHPCTCRGSTKWVHQLCLQRWVDEKQKGNITEKVSCPQCNTEYIIVFPEISRFLFLLGLVDNAVRRLCPFVAAGILMGAIYWIAVTFGAVTVIQVLGNKDGLTSMEQTDPLALLIGLPAIPIILRIIGNREGLTAIEQADLSISVHTLLISLPAIPLVLILGKMVCWEDSVLKFLRKYSCKLPLLKFIMPSFAVNSGEGMRNAYDVTPTSDTVSASGILCSALLLPTIATLCGNVLFETIPSHFHRTLLGGLTFILIKGCLKIYYKQQLYIQQHKKVILDYVQPNNGEKNSQPLQSLT